MKRVILSHCWTGYPEYAWYPYIKESLEQKGFRVKIPTLPDTDFPDPTDWLTTLADEIGRPGKNVTLVGHSLGCAPVLRYLETAPQPVGNVILVACGTDGLGHEETAPFYKHPFDFERIRRNAKHFVAFYSDNDPMFAPTHFKHANLIFKQLAADIMILSGREHYTMSELPEVVACILKLTASPTRKKRN